MNKTRKTLSTPKKMPGLQRETLRSLSETDLRSAGGGSAGMSCCGDCTGSGFLSCIVVC